MFDLPLPFKPVIALNCGSNPETLVRVAYDLKPSMTTCLMYIFKQKGGDHERKTSIGFSTLDAWSLVLGAKTFPEGYAVSGFFFSSQPTRTGYPGFVGTLVAKGGEIRDTKTLNLSRNIVSLQVFFDVSRFSPCVINLNRNKNICCGLKKCGALIG